MTMSAPSPVRRAFADLVSCADDQMDLARAALLIAQEEYPELVVEHYLGRLDALAADVRGLLPERPAHPTTMLAALDRVLFLAGGFHGNTGHYYDPRNSFLNEVLDRRTGIPITIAIVYMEVAARVGLPLAGIGLPGHFIVRYPGLEEGRNWSPTRRHDEEVFLDPFHAGLRLTRSDLAAHFHRLYGADFTFSAEYLTPVTHRQILARLLGNLKGIYVKRRDYGRAVAVVDRLLLLHPDALWELKDRGLLSYRRGDFAGARRDLHQYLKREPDAEDKATLLYYAGLCRRLLMSRN